jgi:lipopolysaccharide/colanic/teichoic acid biosynthesis glycosyltransferase
MLSSIRTARTHGVKLSVLADISRVVSAATEIDRLEGTTLVGIPRYSITRSSMLLKRGFDIALAGIALIALSPLMAVAALAVKLDSGGPVVFRQPRAGRYGRPFQMLKLRSMVEGADEMKHELLHLSESEGLFKMANDPRITRVGRIIRRAHIDELPQLINVLRGDMSMVGPRPLPLEEDRMITGWHRRRLDVRPGITGPWQVLGSSRVPLREMVKLDYQYVADWSLWNDFKILLLTAGRVLGRGGL